MIITIPNNNLTFNDLQERFREATVYFESNPQKSAKLVFDLFSTALTADSQTRVMDEGSHL